MSVASSSSVVSVSKFEFNRFNLAVNEYQKKAGTWNDRTLESRLNIIVQKANRLLRSDLEISNINKVIGNIKVAMGADPQIETVSVTASTVLERNQKEYDALKKLKEALENAITKKEKEIIENQSEADCMDQVGAIEIDTVDRKETKENTQKRDAGPKEQRPLETTKNPRPTVAVNDCRFI